MIKIIRSQPKLNTFCKIVKKVLLFIIFMSVFYSYSEDIQAQEGTITNGAEVQKTGVGGRWCRGPHEIPIQVNVELQPYINLKVDYTNIEWRTPKKGLYTTLFTNVYVISNTDVLIQFDGVENLVPDIARNVAEGRRIIGTDTLVVEVEYTWGGFNYTADDLNESYTYLPAFEGDEDIEIDGEILEGGYKIPLYQRIRVGTDDSQDIWFHDPNGFRMTIVPGI